MILFIFDTDNGVNGYPMCMSPLVQSALRDRFGFSSNHSEQIFEDGADGDDWGEVFGRGQYVVTDSGALSFMVRKDGFVVKFFIVYSEGCASFCESTVE